MTRGVAPVAIRTTSASSSSVVPPARSIATLPGATGTQPDWSALAAVAGDANALLDKLSTLLLHNTMSAATRAAIVPAINAVPDPLTRARTAFYLVATSSQFQVER